MEPIGGSGRKGGGAAGGAACGPGRATGTGATDNSSDGVGVDVTSPAKQERDVQDGRLCTGSALLDCRLSSVQRLKDSRCMYPSVAVVQASSHSLQGIAPAGRSSSSAPGGRSSSEFDMLATSPQVCASACGCPHALPRASRGRRSRSDKEDEFVIPCQPTDDLLSARVLGTESTPRREPLGLEATNRSICESCSNHEHGNCA